MGPFVGPTVREVAGLPLTDAHVARIHAFVQGRVAEAWYEAEHQPVPESIQRALGGLYRVTASLGARADSSVPSVGNQRTDEIMAAAVRLSQEFAWNDLRDVAKQWRDHPAYLAEFDCDAPDLPEEKDTPWS
jgi:hypothetical protein